MEEKSKIPELFWPLLGIACLAILASVIVVRHVVNYDDFAVLTIANGLPAPPEFPQWQRIILASVSAFGFVAAVGMFFRRSWGVYLFIGVFIIGQTFGFAIGQTGVPSFLAGIAVIILSMNYLHRMK